MRVVVTGGAGFIGSHVVDALARTSDPARHVDGFADPQAGTALSPQHLFEIGSISKSFTALAVLWLVDSGQVSLDDPITRHLPWFEVQTVHDPITIRRLLDHSSGLIMGADSYPDERVQVWNLRTSATGSAPGTMFSGSPMRPSFPLRKPTFSCQNTTRYCPAGAFLISNLPSASVSVRSRDSQA